MKIGIDARFAISNRRGIGNYSLNLINNLSKLGTNHHFILYIDQVDKNKELPIAENIEVRLIKCKNYLIWEQILLPLYTNIDSVDLFHSLGNTGPLMLHPRINLVVTIHDVMFLQNNYKPESLYRIFGKLYSSIVVKSLTFFNKISKLITVSQFSKQDIIKSLKGISVNEIYVTLESYNESVFIADDMPLTNNMVGDMPYLLCLGASDPRKNTQMIIDVFIELVTECGFNGNLVIVGFKGWNKSEIGLRMQNHKLLSRIIFFEYVSDLELKTLYQNALLFLYPSLYEGFGIPPLEAMACGCPVIASNITSIPEIVSDSGLLIDPYSRSEIVKSCLSIINSQTLRTLLVNKGFEHVKKFSWSKMTIETIEVYNQKINK